MDTSMIVVLLVGLIQIILILSVVHISGKVDEICKEIKDLNEKTNEKLGKIMFKTDGCQKVSAPDMGNRDLF